MGALVGFVATVGFGIEVVFEGGAGGGDGGGNLALGFKGGGVQWVGATMPKRKAVT